MSLSSMHERFAACERRALDLYRRFAEHFAADPEAARLWGGLSNAAADPFSLLPLAGGTRGSFALGEAVEAAVTLEQEDLPRIRRILGALPPAARGSILGGIVLGLPAHYACLGRLAARGGVAGVGAALEALQGEA